MDTVRIEPGFRITLPPEARKSLKEGDAFILVLAGDSIQLKKLDAGTLLDRAAGTPDPDQPSSEEIERIVREVRSSRA